jgi:hypothetical protein
VTRLPELIRGPPRLAKATLRDRGHGGMMIHTETSRSQAADRLAIGELIDAYAHCADRRDADGQGALHCGRLEMTSDV